MVNQLTYGVENKWINWCGTNKQDMSLKTNKYT